MKKRSLFTSAYSPALLTILLVVPFGAAHGADAFRITGPYAYDNLSIYLIHGQDRLLQKMLTLQDGLEQNKVVVHETGNVQELAIENISGDETIFVQAGDIVKGGRQDRVLSQDLVLKPRSGKVPIGSFCVESGRWGGRGHTAAASFASSNNSLSSRALKLAARARKDQGQVWLEVANFQDKLARAVGASVKDSASQTSLQLSLENGAMKARVADYESPLRKLLEEHPGAVGFGAAINGKISLAEVYATRDLFEKLWPKLLNSAATEALAERPLAGGAPFKLPDAAAVQNFLDSAGHDSESDVVLFESKVDAEGAGWVHRSYLAR